MSNLLAVDVDGETIYIEVEEEYGSEDTTNVNEALDKAKDAFEHAKTTITSVSKSVVKAIKKMDEALTPDEFMLEFGIKFSADGTVFVASAGVEAHLKVSMAYFNSAQPLRLSDREE